MLSLKNKIINLSLIDYCTKVQNTALIAFGYTLQRKNKDYITNVSHLEDAKLNLELFLYDIQAIETTMTEGLEYLVEELGNLGTSVDISDKQNEDRENIELYISTQTMALLALWSTQINDNKSLLLLDNLPELKSGVEALLVNLETILDGMTSSMDYLWSIKDKIATERADQGISPTFCFKQQEEPPRATKNNTIATSKIKNQIPKDIPVDEDNNPIVKLHFDGIFKQVLKLEALKAVVRGGKFAMTTDYAKGLDREEIADYFEGIALIAEPIINDLYELQSEESREAFETFASEKSEV